MLCCSWREGEIPGLEGEPTEEDTDKVLAIGLNAGQADEVLRYEMAFYFGMSITYSRTNFRLPVWPCASRQRNT